MEGAFTSGPGWARGLGWSLLTLSVLSAGCSNYVGTTAASFLRRIREDPDPNLRYIAYTKLAQPNCYDSAAQKAEAVQVLVFKLEQGKEPVATRAVIINTLGALRDPAARDAIVKLVNDPEPVLRVQACRALGKVGTPEDATVLTRVMNVDALEDCRIAAIEGLGELKPDDPRITRMLIAGMRNEDPATRLASLRALRRITRKDYGLDALAWEKALPQDGDGQTQLATAAPASSPKPSAPVYPPRPVAPQSVVDSDVLMVGKPTAGDRAKNPDEQGASFGQQVPRGAGPPPGVGIGSYPVHNPNLPPNPAAP